jgi:hypothetical protein
MATLFEYFKKDFSDTFSVEKGELSINDKNGKPVCNVLARLHLDLAKNAKFISYYIPKTSEVDCPSRVILNSYEWVLNLSKDTEIHGFIESESLGSSQELVFTGRIFIYSEDEISEENKTAIISDAKKVGHSVIIRTENYAKEREKWEIPLAFISHNSRDKKQLAEPLAIALQSISCSVWYDEYSLKVGDSLREGIEKGLRECKKCIFLITPNFLVNGGWTKREYDSIFTRELIEDRKLILPVWHGVTKQEVYQYSPILADRVAVVWDGDIKNIANRLRQSII